MNDNQTQAPSPLEQATAIFEGRTTEAPQGLPEAKATSEAGTVPGKDTPEVKPPTDPKTNPDFSRHFATISRKEQAILKREQEIKAREDKLRQSEELEQLFDKDPVAYIEKRGKKFESVLEGLIGKPEPTPQDEVALLKAEVKALAEERKQEREANEKAKVESERLAKEQSEQKQLAAFVENIKNEISKDTEKFELITAYGKYDAVLALINEHAIKINAQSPDQLMSIAEAAEKVENYLFDQLKGEATRLRGTKKLANLFAKTEETPDVQEILEGVEDQALRSEPRTRPTLTSTSTAMTTPDGSLDTPEKREAAALAIFKKAAMTKT